MGFTPLGNSFHSPLPSRPLQVNVLLPRSGVANGQRLYDEVTEVYTWYISSWYTPSVATSSLEGAQANETIRKTLSQIKRIAEVSIQGGSFLSEREEQKALDRLRDVLQDWNSGELRKQEIPHALYRLVDELTGQNPKARVVFQTTELEYRLCINPPQGQPPDLTERYRQVLAGNILKITPDLHDVHAGGISQGLSRVLEYSNPSDDLHSALQEAIRRWI